MRWPIFSLVPRRPQPRNRVARGIIEWTDVAYYVVFRIACVAILATIAAAAAQRVL